ncbi:hypothetical protein D3C87_1408730 [compost metagenome]
MCRLIDADSVGLSDPLAPKKYLLISDTEIWPWPCFSPENAFPLPPMLMMSGVVFLAEQ